MKLVIVGFLLALSASFVLATDLDLQAMDEAANSPALVRVRRSGSESKCDDDDDDADDEDCCQNSCDEDYFYEMVLKFEDKDANKNLDLGRVIVNEKDCEGPADKSESDRSRSRSRSRSHSSDSSDSSD